MWQGMSPMMSSPWILAATALASVLGAWGGSRDDGLLHPDIPRADGRLAAATDVVLEPVLTNLANPVLVTHAGDGSGRLFVVEQAGVIKVLQAEADTPTVFLDIRSQVLSGGERGLLGLAFHPSFESNRRFFVNYTRRTDGATVVAEYHASAANPNVSDPTEIVILTVAQPFDNHNGGMIEFGPDGNLYIAMGDGGSSNDPDDRAQNVDELLGKILRIDIDHPSGTQRYSSPATNPFAGLIPGRDEIYAFGFRNPWRFSFDRLNGVLVVGDVGQGAREEIDLVVRGGNYGWRTLEGTRCTGLDPPPCDPNAFMPPIAEYENAGPRCAVTGGYVYRGSRGTLPSGSYLFGDYCSGELFLLEGGQFAPIAETGLNISSFGQDQDGELYVVDHGGAVYRVGDASPCRISISPPGHAFRAEGGTGAVGVTAAGGCDWTASTEDDWIAITEGGSGIGAGTVRYHVAVNTGARRRSGVLRIAGQGHNILQGAPRRCPIDVDPRRVLVDAGGVTGTIAVVAGDGCQWTARSLVGWIVVTSGETGTGSGLVEYRVDPNPSGRPRFARLRIGAIIVVIRQQ